MAAERKSTRSNSALRKTSAAAGKSPASDNTRKPQPTPLSATASAVQDSSSALDRLIHERTRLALVSTLATTDSLSFNELKALLKVSDGNLSTHARKLEEAGYLLCEKRFEGRLPRTVYRLSTSGRAALQRYLGHMEALIKAVGR